MSSMSEASSLSVSFAISLGMSKRTARASNNSFLIRNIRLVIDIGDTTIQVPLNGPTVVQNIGRQAAAAVAGDSSAGGVSEKTGGAGGGGGEEWMQEQDGLLCMRGWLMAVATLFAAMAFQAALRPPGWMPAEAA
ncbi:Os03g0619002 [Oryza sativa Japonica Group]|uniref:Os03g0619002 protein n=1 Tax=Oryza sativa subsp. japonica TaxID=39947 RepID=A0A0P0W068_ORYSJ|nr:Os03g0619002 [Oryza sativa Japonica Group]